MCQRVLHATPSPPDDPPLPNHQRCAYRLWPELLNQEDTFADDTFITINQGNLIKKVISASLLRLAQVARVQICVPLSPGAADGQVGGHVETRACAPVSAD